MEVDDDRGQIGQLQLRIEVAGRHKPPFAEGSNRSVLACSRKIADSLPRKAEVAVLRTRDVAEQPAWRASLNFFAPKPKRGRDAPTAAPGTSAVTNDIARSSQRGLLNSSRATGHRPQ